MDCAKIRLENINLVINGHSIIRDVSLSIEKNKTTLISGESGSGKTSLLNIMNFLYVPTNGILLYDEHPVNFLNKKWIDEIRNKEIAYCHQELALIENISLLQNLQIFSSIKGVALDTDKLSAACQLLGVERLLNKNISIMSGGERQRTAFIKLLLFDYALILIDEPTNNLDIKNIDYILQGIRQLKKRNNATLVIISHSQLLEEIADNTFDMKEINHG